MDQSAPITERDIVAEIYFRLKTFCRENGLSVHCEIKPATDEDAEPKRLIRLPKIDVGILASINERTWISSALKLQDNQERL